LASATPTADEEGGMGAGAIASLIVGVLVFGLLGGAGIMFACRDKCHKGLPTKQPTAQLTTKQAVNTSYANTFPTHIQQIFYERIAVNEAELYDPVYTQSPFEGMDKLPVTSLSEAAAAAQMHCGGDLQAAVNAAEAFAAMLAVKKKLGVLTQAEAAALNLYSQETPLYHFVNGAIQGYGEGGRDVLHHYLPYIKLFLAALLKLPPLPTTIVYRGVRLPRHMIIRGASAGDQITWWGIISTSRSADALRSVNFLGVGEEGAANVGERTVFQIRSTGGRDISPYCVWGEEEAEVILPPGSRFTIDTITTGLEYNIVEVRMHQLEVVSNSTYAVAGQSGGTGDTLYAEPIEEPLYDEAHYLLPQAMHNQGGGDANLHVVNEEEYDMPSSDASNATITAVTSFIHAEYAPGMVNTATYSADVFGSSKSNAAFYTNDAYGNVPGSTANNNSAAAGEVCIQNTSNGPCQNRALVETGAVRCADHTCQHLGCSEGKSSKLQYCNTHSRMQNPAAGARPRAQTAWNVPLSAVGGGRGGTGRGTGGGGTIQRNSSARKGSVYAGFGGDTDESGV
jgi:hypothetical protein